MAASEEEVVKSLVGKIEKSNIGCSLLDILSHIDHLCQASKSPETTIADGSSRPPGILTEQNARPSPERIWRLLTEDPQISVGFERQFNALTLADLWDHNVAALARIYFVVQKTTQNLPQSILTGVSEILSSRSDQRSSDNFVEQTVVTSRNQTSVPSNATLMETTAKQADLVATLEIKTSASDEQTPFVFDNPSPGNHPEQAGVRRSGRARRSSSRYTTEMDEIPSPQYRHTSRRPSRSASNMSAKPGKTISKQIPKHTRPSTIPSSLRPQVMNNSPRYGGSRKYLKGTEGFWKEMFWHARNQCEGYMTSRSKAGIATHPGARALYATRPAGIDEIILGAMEAGLPLPIDPQDITSAWRDRTAWMLNRSENGVYISPEGVRRVDASQYADHSDAPLCQILILRSTRLREVDFSEREEHPNPLQPTDSVSHAVRHHSFFSSRPTSMTGPFGPHPPATSAEKNLKFMAPVPKLNYERGPRLGVFHLNDITSMDDGVPSMPSGEDPSTPARRERRRRDSRTVNITSSADSISRTTTVSLESPDLPEEQHTTHEVMSWRGLPPPLTTRSQKRKVSGQLHAGARSPKRQRANDVVLEDVSGSQPSVAITSEATSRIISDAMEVDNARPSTVIPFSSPTRETRPQKEKAPKSRKPHENRKEVVKEMLLEVVEECGGMIPNEYSCISDYMNQKWRARSRSGQPDKKLCKDAIKSLCTNGRLKRLAFTFQKRSGIMTTSSMLTGIDVEATSGAVMRLQQNIINALPDLYVPPLGSVLEAPPIEAPPQATPPTTPTLEKRLSGGKRSAQAVNIQRSRMKHGSRKDILGASPSRKPFIWLGPPHHTSIPGSDNVLALAFAYVSAEQSERGPARWLNAEAGPTEEEQLPAKQKTAMPRSRFNMSTRKPRGPGITDLGSRQAQKDKPNCRTERTSTPLTFDPEAYDEPAVEDIIPNGLPKFGRSSRGRKIIWKTRDSDVLPPTLPASLQDIVNMPGQIPMIDYSMTEDPDTNFFYWELDAVEYWEMNILKIYQQQASDWTFINHSTKIRRTTGLETYTQLQWEEPNILTTMTFTPGPTYIKRGQPPRKPKGPKVLIEQIDDEPVDSDYDPAVEGGVQAPARKLKRRLSLQPIRRPKGSVAQKNYTRRPYRRLREDGHQYERQGRPRILQNMAAEEIYHIVIAVIVVRTLAGGITGDIDWPIVQKMCPDRDEAFLADRWSTLVIKNRQDITNLTESMQKKYIIAYEKGEVPCINFDDVQNSAWDPIVSWAEQNLDKSLSDGIAALPGTRSELLRTTTFTFDEPQTLRDALAHTGQQLRALKEEILANTPAAVPLQSSANDAIGLRIEAEVEEQDFNLSVAKSWAVSTVMTPHDSLDPTAVTKKLSSITSNKKEAEELFDKALRALQRNLVIKRKTKNAMHSGWRASERWSEMFDTKRMITASMLKKSAGWKKDVLDSAAERGLGVQIDKTQLMQDGEMVAIINMVANGRCKITASPEGFPKGRYGLDPDAMSYNTKGMSRLLTLFATTVQPTRDYVAGDPMAAQRLQIPTWQDGARGKIPCWIDMNGNVLTDIWEMVISAIVGLLSGRPGIQALEIERSLGHGVTGWEVDMALSWLEGSGFVQNTRYGTGWETKEWWWMVCGFT